MLKRGFTLIELLAVIVILAVIALIATPIILGIINDTKKSAFKDSAYGISGAAKNTFIEEMYAGAEPQEITFTYVDGVETSNPNGYTLNYEGEKPQNGEVILNNQGQVALALYNGKWCAKKSPKAAEVTIEEKALEECTVLMDRSGANAPVLSNGMTPVIWSGSAWVEATDATDPYSQNWYNYKNKKWANAMTADGSLWVWIPRYIYKISSGWHTDTAGTIEVQFTEGTNDNWNSATIGSIDTGAGASASQNKWTNHPAFKFGSMEMTGFWIAKFEASPPATSSCYTTVNETNCNVTNITPLSKPNTTAWRKINVSTAFTVTRNMETNNIYGWNVASVLKADGTFTSDNNGVDTHLIKNTEWGATVYFTQSIYGATGANIAGDYVYDDDILTGENYTTTLNYSTTGNIYGIYDMRAGFEEITSSYVTGYSTNLTNFGSVLTTADTKYVNVYNLGGDSSATNYPALVNYKGDAMWETSSADNGNYAWYDGPTVTLYNVKPFVVRGNYAAISSIYSFYNSTGGEVGGHSDVDTFRTVILVGSGL